MSSAEASNESMASIVSDLQTQLREIRTVHSLLSTDKATARHLWKTLQKKYPSLCEPHKPVQVLDESKRPKELSLEALQKNALEADTVEADLELLSSHRKTVALRDELKNARQHELHATASSYPSRVLLILEEHNILSEELRLSISEIDKRVEITKSEIRDMGCEQQKWMFALERFDHQLFGYEFSPQDGEKLHCLTHFDEFYDQLKLRFDFEKAALEEKLRLALDIFDRNEYTIMEDQRPKIELFQNSLPGAEAGSGTYVSRSFLAPHERTLNISQLQQLAKEKEIECKFLKQSNDRAQNEFERVLQRATKSHKLREEELETLKGNAWGAYHRKQRELMRSPEENILRKSVSFHMQKRQSISPVKSSPQSPVQATTAGNPEERDMNTSMPTFTQAMEEDTNHKKDQLNVEEEQGRSILFNIEVESYKLLKTMHHFERLKIAEKELDKRPMQLPYGPRKKTAAQESPRQVKEKESVKTTKKNAVVSQQAEEKDKTVPEISLTSHNNETKEKTDEGHHQKKASGATPRLHQGDSPRKSRGATPRSQVGESPTPSSDEKAMEGSSLLVTNTELES